MRAWLTTFDGKPSAEIPFAGLPRYDRPKASGQADETEEKDDDSHSVDENDKENAEMRKQQEFEEIAVSITSSTWIYPVF
ncbi:hypothetical protein AX17_004752 [Amanita inopinata Kibby_2008]|nr:hypothetical protein AX17_004752 [Amanita inopinata Kibby_2008]